MDPAEGARTFIRAWNVDSDEERLALLRRCCHPQGVFVSPQGSIAGIEAFASSIGAFRRAFPAARVDLGRSDVHNGYLRFRWQTVWNDGRQPLSGEDFVELSPEGLILKVVSFDGSPAAP